MYTGIDCLLLDILSENNSSIRGLNKMGSACCYGAFGLASSEILLTDVFLLDFDKCEVVDFLWWRIWGFLLPCGRLRAIKTICSHKVGKQNDPIRYAICLIYVSPKSYIVLVPNIHSYRLPPLPLTSGALVDKHFRITEMITLWLWLSMFTIYVLIIIYPIDVPIAQSLCNISLYTSNRLCSTINCVISSFLLFKKNRKLLYGHQCLLFW